MRRRAVDAAFAALPALVVWILYHPVRALWWTMDDLFNLHFVSDHPFPTYLKPAVWKLLPMKLYTPLMFVSLEGDLRAAGFEARTFYLHQLGALMVAVVLSYFVIRLWRPPAIAAMGALLVAAGAPFCTITQQLMDRHYIEGLAFAAIALILYVRGWPAMSAVAYFAAALAKEIYVPLPLVLALIPGSEPRWKRLRAHAVAAAVYFILRFINLGTLGGGYGFVVMPDEWPRLAVLLPWKIAQQLGGGPAAIVLLLCAAAAFVLAIRGDRKLLPLIVVAFFIALAPILPVSKAIDPRYALGAWLCVCLILIAAARDKAGIALLSIAVVATLFCNRIEWHRTYENARRMSAEARAFLAIGNQSLLREPAVPPAAMGELSWLKEKLHAPAGGVAFYDDVYLCTHQVNGYDIWQYVPAERGVRNVTVAVQRDLRRICATPNLPLNVHFTWKDGILRWDVGPYEEGQYRFVLADGVQAFDMPPHDAFRVGTMTELRLTVVYNATDGRRTYSPPFTLDLRKPGSMSWQR